MGNKKLVKVRTADLRVGMFVHDVGRGWLTHPWPTRQKLITSKSDIQQLVEHGISQVIVDIDRGDAPGKEHVPREVLGHTGVERSPQIAEGDLAAKAERARPTKNIRSVERRSKPRPDPAADSVSLVEELPQARKAYSRALDITRCLMSDVRAGRKMEVGPVKENVESMIDSVFRNRDAMMALLKLKNYDEYTFTHSLNVAVLAVSVGRHLGLDRAKLAEIGLGAIFHDVGKQLIPMEIINKPAKLTDEEFNIVKGHPVLGFDLCANNKQVSTLALQIIRHHHERLDGTGYPDQLSQERITSIIAISAMCDVYDALSSDRVYHKGMLPHEALKVVYNLSGKHFPQTWVERFIQSMGIYPAGATVRLSTGELGIVMMVNRGHLLTPKIRLVKNARGNEVTSFKVLDLCEDGMTKRRIVQVIDPRTEGIDPVKYLTNGHKK